MVLSKLSSNIIGDSNYENDFSHRLLLTNTQVSRLRKAFPNSSSANKKLLKTHLHQIGQSRRFLNRPLVLEPVLKTALSVTGNTLKPLATSALIPLVLTASARVAAIHKKILGSGTKTSINGNEEINDITKISKSLEDSGLLINN